MEQIIEVTAADVEAAIAEGLQRLQADRESVEIEVLDEGSRGLMGFGARDARVRLAIKSQPAPDDGDAFLGPDEGQTLQTAPVGVEIEDEDEAEAERDEAAVGLEALLELLALMGIRGASVEAQHAEPAAGEQEGPLVFDVRGPGTDPLIGPRGETLAALQHITRLIVGQELAKRSGVVVDVGGFKERRRQSLERLAHRLADQAVRTNRTVVLEPMPPHERRIVHLALRDHPRVTTESVGAGDRRKVTIIPRE